MVECCPVQESRKTKKETLECRKQIPRPKLKYMCRSNCSRSPWINVGKSTIQNVPETKKKTKKVQSKSLPGTCKEREKGGERTNEGKEAGPGALPSTQPNIKRGPASLLCLISLFENLCSYRLGKHSSRTTQRLLGGREVIAKLLAMHPTEDHFHNARRKAVQSSMQKGKLTRSLSGSISSSAKTVASKLT